MAGRRPTRQDFIDLGMAIALCAAALASSPARADTPLAPIGGPGGGYFTTRCPIGKALWGVELRTGDDVDAVRPICVTPVAPTEVTADAPVDPWHGGDGGAPHVLSCVPSQPAVRALYVGYEGQDTVIVNNIHLFCGDLSGKPQPLGLAPTAMFDGPPYQHGPDPFSHFYTADHEMQQCPPGQVAVGITGRSGIWLDALGLLCGFSPLVQPVHSIGRAGGGSSTPAPTKRRTICQQAVDALKRRSPVTAQLVAACLQSGQP